MSALTDIFTSIANAIRTKNQSATTYKPSEMSSAILAIPTGGGGTVQTLKQASVDVSAYNPSNKPVVSPSSGYDSMEAVELTLNNIPSAGNPEALKQASVDVSTYNPSNKPVILPTSGYDSMESVELTLNNIPSSGATMSIWSPYGSIPPNHIQKLVFNFGASNYPRTKEEFYNAKVLIFTYDENAGEATVSYKTISEIAPSRLADCTYNIINEYGSTWIDTNMIYSASTVWQQTDPITEIQITNFVRS